MGEVTITLSDRAADLVEDSSVETARRQLLWESLMEAVDKLACELEAYGPHEIRLPVLHSHVERVSAIADELATATGEDQKIEEKRKGE